MILQWKPDNDGRQWTARWCDRVLTLSLAAPGAWKLRITTANGEHPARAAGSGTWNSFVEARAAVEKVMERIIAARLHSALMWPASTGHLTSSTANVSPNPCGVLPASSIKEVHKKAIPLRERRRAGPFSAYDDDEAEGARRVLRNINEEAAHA